MKKRRMLIVEDDPGINKMLSDNFLEGGWLTRRSATYADALTSIDQDWDAAIIDWMLPDGDGLEIASQIRKRSQRIAIIMLTARDAPEDTVRALKSGCSDYIVKPFHMAVLEARLIRLLPDPDPTIAVDEIVLNPVAQIVTASGREIQLTSIQFDLLEFFLRNPNRVFSRDEIIECVWGYDAFPTTRTVDNQVLVLRKCFGAHRIETVRKVGYRFFSNTGK